MPDRDARQVSANTPSRIADLADLATARGSDPVTLLRSRSFDPPGLRSAVGEEIDPDLALHWWLRASHLPCLALATGEEISAVVVAAAPDAGPPPLARLRWLASGARANSPRRTWQFLRRLAASERHRPSAPHTWVPLLAAQPGAGAAQQLVALLDAVRARSARHPASTGVCCETGDAAVAARLEELGYRPVARFRCGGVRQLALFRADAGAEPFAEPVVVPIEDSIDLHRFRPDEIAEVVDGYLEAAREAGLREVRIIHGRGRGVQRHRVQRLLAGDARVERFGDAPADRGGRGATLAWLSTGEQECD